jgi:hypothetical protein
VTDPKKGSKDVFEESRQQFLEAHNEGIQSLRNRDLGGLAEAIEKERAAIEKAAVSIESVSIASRTSDAPLSKGVESTDGGGSLMAEHARLLEQLHALEREHRELETRPYDLEAHRGHRERLEQQIVELRAHLLRLRGKSNEK